MIIRNKKGIIGSFLGLFVMTALVILILVVFVLGSGLVKKMDKVEGGVALFDESNVGLVEILNYSDDYASLTEARFLVEDGYSIDSALLEVGYEE